MMKKYQINYSDEAIADLLEPANAVNLVNAIKDAIRSLDIFPFRHQQVEWLPWKEKGMRYLISKKHVIFYFVNESNNSVSISRIFSCKRNIPAIIAEEESIK